MVDAYVLTGSHACMNTQIYTNICQLLPEPLEKRSLSIFSDPQYPMADTCAHINTHRACHFISSISVRNRCMLSHTENTHTETASI